MAHVLRFVLTKLEVITHRRPRFRHLVQPVEVFWPASQRSCRHQQCPTNGEIEDDYLLLPTFATCLDPRASRARRINFHGEGRGRSESEVREGPQRRPNAEKRKISSRPGLVRLRLATCGGEIMDGSRLRYFAVGLAGAVWARPRMVEGRQTV
jgi:hypothetical protein